MSDGLLCGLGLKPLRAACQSEYRRGRIPRCLASVHLLWGLNLRSTFSGEDVTLRMVVHGHCFTDIFLCYFLCVPPPPRDLQTPFTQAVSRLELRPG
jgi:hypothetical protein